MPTEKECKDKGKILNPISGRCIGKDTKKGKEILEAKKAAKKSKSLLKRRDRSKSKSSLEEGPEKGKIDCDKIGKIYNPDSGRCVGKDTKKGKEILAAKKAAKSPNKKSPLKSTKSQDCYFPEKCGVSKDFSAADIQKIAEGCGINIYKKEGGKAKKSRNVLCNEIEKNSPKSSPKKASPKKSPILKSKKELAQMSVKTLQEFAKTNGIKGYSGKKKQDLVDLIYVSLSKKGSPKKSSSRVDDDFFSDEPVFSNVKSESKNSSEESEESATMPLPKKSPIFKSQKELARMSVKALQEFAKTNGIKGYSGKKKQDLVDLIYASLSKKASPKASPKVDDDFFSDEPAFSNVKSESKNSSEEPAPISIDSEKEPSFEASEPDLSKAPKGSGSEFDDFFSDESVVLDSLPKKSVKNSRLLQLRRELKSKGIMVNKDSSSEELQEIMNSDCDTDNYSCTNGKKCFINDSGQGKCISPGQYSRGMKGSPIKEYTFKGKTYIGSEKAIENLKAKMEPVPEKKLLKEDIEDLLQEIKEPTKDTESLKMVRSQLYKCLGLISE